MLMHIHHTQVCVFTASLAKYADPLIDKLDPHGYVDYRLFRCVVYTYVCVCVCI
jgi:RNA polymerase II subunit A small phosphatase-like protein